MTMTLDLPLFTRGLVVKGFGRGSKQLGVPTANLDDNVITNLPANIRPGVYYGWAQVNNGTVHQMVTSIGWNPYYKNIKKSMEVHIFNQFSEDFYGSLLGVVLLGYIRDQADFTSLDQLIAAINEDIRMSKEALSTADCLRYKDVEFFKQSQENTTNGYHPGSNL